MIRAYKLFRKRRDGSISPLFINAKQRIPVGKWLRAESHPTKGFAYRPGWHCVPKKRAPHLSTKGRVWCVVEVRGVKRFQRPKGHGGEWILANQMKVVKELKSA